MASSLQPPGRASLWVALQLTVLSLRSSHEERSHAGCQQHEGPDHGGGYQARRPWETAERSASATAHNYNTNGLGLDHTS